MIPLESIDAKTNNEGLSEKKQDSCHLQQFSTDQFRLFRNTVIQVFNSIPKKFFFFSETISIFDLQCLFNTLSFSTHEFHTLSHPSLQTRHNGLANRGVICKHGGFN